MFPILRSKAIGFSLVTVVTLNIPVIVYLSMYAYTSENRSKYDQKENILYTMHISYVYALKTYFSI